MEQRLAELDAALDAFDPWERIVEDIVEDAQFDNAALRAHVEIAALFEKHREDEPLREHLGRALAIDANAPDEIALRLRALTMLARCEDPPQDLASMLRDTITRTAAPTAQALIELGDLTEGEEAATAFLRAAELTDGEEEAHARSSASRALDKLGRFDEAEAQERKILTLAVEADTIRFAEYQIARLLGKRGAHEEARRLLEARLAAEPRAYGYSELYRALRLAGVDAEAAYAEGHRLALADATREIDPRIIAWLTGDAEGRSSVAQLVDYMVFLEASYGGIDSVDKLESERVFGPHRDYTCGCGKYSGFENYGTVCEVCMVETVPAIVRRWRLGSMRLRAPVVHPRARHIAAMLLDCREEDVTPELVDRIYLTGLREDLEEARERGQLRAGYYPIADRLAIVDQMLASEIRPSSFLITYMPVVCDHRAAYARLVEANAEGASTPLEDPVAGVFRCFAPLPKPISANTRGETHTRAFELPRGVIVRPMFDRQAAGTAFVLAAGDRTLLVTSLHVVPPGTKQVRFSDAFDHTFAGNAGAALELDADAAVPARDIAAFQLDRRPALELATRDARDGERIYLAGSAKAGAPATQPLHPARVIGFAVDGTQLIEFDIAGLVLGGLSGAPLLRGDGTVVGILNRYIPVDDECRRLHAYIMPASAIREILS